MEVAAANSTDIQSVYFLKEFYDQQIELYKNRRREMHGKFNVFFKITFYNSAFVFKIPTYWKFVQILFISYCPCF